MNIDQQIQEHRSTIQELKAKGKKKYYQNNYVILAAVHKGDSNNITNDDYYINDLSSDGHPSFTTGWIQFTRDRLGQLTVDDNDRLLFTKDEADDFVHHADNEPLAKIVEMGITPIQDLARGPEYFVPRDEYYADDIQEHQDKIDELYQRKFRINDPTDKYVVLAFNDRGHNKYYEDDGEDSLRSPRKDDTYRTSYAIQHVRDDAVYLNYYTLFTKQHAMEFAHRSHDPFYSRLLEAGIMPLNQMLDMELQGEQEGKELRISDPDYIEFF